MHPAIAVCQDLPNLGETSRFLNEVCEREFKLYENEY